jgi:phosphatidylserine/phosphatidylglycerophosphate/cardiolipin synthase-like enzyme
MRIRVTHQGLSVHAIAGSEVVLFGLDVPEAMAAQLLGFGFERIDEEAGTRAPLRGLKTFAATEPPNHRPGRPVSTLQHPVQAFLWGDYEANPGTDYTYRVVALGGTPENLQPLAEVMVPVQTETPARGRHGVWFNRGVAGSQAYARQFQNRPPAEVANRRAWTWLSRGLDEALHAFINRAARGDQLRAALYETREPRVLAAFARARDRGVDVRLVIDGKHTNDLDSRTGERHDIPREANLAAVAAAGIDDLVIRRETNPSYIAHNKSIVHIRDGQPVAVWTGSTNISEGGIFGHANVGHVVRDPAVAAQFLAYWEQLAADPTRATLADWNESHPVPAGAPPRGVSTVFSPRRSLEALEWYAGQMAGAKGAAFLTAAFGISEPLREVLAREQFDALRYGLLERSDAKIEMLKRDRDNMFAAGAKVGEEMGGWAKEALTGLNGHVQYIHTKFMLVDPLSTNPIVITGSANFSAASTKNNDENMLVIRGDARVAEIYLTEFMRLFNHFEARQRVPLPRRPELAGGTATGIRPASPTMAAGEPKTGSGFRHLEPVPGWALEHFVEGWQRHRERLYFR